ncbi:MAG: hypothetical protein OK456_04985 [Thaumarchaeota archaeon]|nr:hypothetical protein [Nitrososphaerota archaeon]
MGRRNSKRSKIELYAQILEVVTHYPEGIRITRLSYGVRVPVDRLKLLVEKLCSLGLTRRYADEEETHYGSTPKGLEFLDTYFRMKGFLDELDKGSHLQ